MTAAVAEKRLAPAECPPPTSQRELFAAACATPSSTTCLVDAQFLAQWRLHTARKAAAPAPGALDNRGATRSDARWWRDFECVPPAAYDLLVKWYGGGPRVVRPVAASGGVGAVAKPCKEPLDAASGGVGDVAKPCKEPLDAACGACGRALAVATAQGCGACLAVAYCDARCQRGHWARHRRDCGKWRADDAAPAADAVEAFARLRDARTDLAKRGLRNLGNTCYFNATVQCLARCAPLSRHLLSDAFLGDVNAPNALGSPRAQLAQEYAAALKRCWRAPRGAVAPRGLLNAVARFRPDFEGRRQHDAHELLQTLLHGLHEDLNRVRGPKPYFTTPEALTGADDAPVAVAHGRCEKLRDDSIVCDTFGGLLRSTLECPACGHRCAHFEPFFTLDVELAGDAGTSETVDDDDDSGCSDDDANDVLPAGTIVLYPSPLPLPAPPFEVPDEDRVAAVRSAAAAALEASADDVVLASLRSGDVLSNDDELPDGVAAFVLPAGARACLAYGGGGLPRAVVYRPDEPAAALAARALAAYDRPAGDDPCARLRVDANSQNDDDDLVSVGDDWRVARDRRRTKRRDGDCGALLGAARVRRVDVVLDEAAAPEAPPRDRAAVACAVAFATAVRDAAARVVEGEALERRRRARAARRRSRRALARAAREVDTCDPFSGLHLPYAPRVAPLSLRGCLRRFTSPETLLEEEAWRCGGCQTMGRATKRIAVWRAPPILVVALKRFARSTRKVDRYVDFPLEGLDLAPHVAHAGGDSGREDLVYDLCGVVNHFGAAGYGHYTAFARDLFSVGGPGPWLRCDDSSVVEVPAEDVRSSAAYVLFYARRDAVAAESASAPY